MYFHSFLDDFTWLISTCLKVFFRLLTSSCGVPLNHLLMVSYVTINMSTLSSNVAGFKYMIHYQLHVKALLLLKQITANHTLYFWPCLKCSLLPISLSLPCYLSPFIFPSFCVYRRDGFSYHHLTDTDHIRGNQSPAGDKMNGMEIKQRNAAFKCY